MALSSLEVRLTCSGVGGSGRKWTEVGGFAIRNYLKLHVLAVGMLAAFMVSGNATFSVARRAMTCKHQSDNDPEFWRVFKYDGYINKYSGFMRHCICLLPGRASFSEGALINHDVGVFTMKRMIPAIFVASIAVAGQAFAGSFSSSCKNISLNGAHLKAKCQMAVGGKWADESSINLNDHIGNRNGVLIWDSKKFDDHCESKWLDAATFSKQLLKARCKTNNGTYVNAEVNLNERISNINGKLKYDQ
jgi:hypothetical protein